MNDAQSEPKQEAPMRCFIVITSHHASKAFTRSNLTEKWEQARKKGDTYIKLEMATFLVESIQGVVDIAKVERCQKLYQEQFKQFDLTVPDGRIIAPIGSGISDIGGH